MLTHDDVQPQTQSEHYVNFMSSESQKYFLYMWALCFRFVFVNFTMQKVQAIKFSVIFTLLLLQTLLEMVVLNRGLICSVILHVIKENHESRICLITNLLGVINTVKYPNNAELKAVNSQSDQRTFFILNCFLSLFFFQQYQADSEKNWKAKDAAIFLVTSLASKKQTAKVISACALNLLVAVV